MSLNNSKAIEVSNLTKYYGDLLAVDHSTLRCIRARSSAFWVLMERERQPPSAC